MKYKMLLKGFWLFFFQEFIVKPVSFMSNATVSTNETQSHTQPVDVLEQVNCDR